MMLTEKDAHAILAKFVASHRTQQEAAQALGVSQQFLSDIKSRGRTRNVPESILKPLGLKRITRIERLKRKNGANGSK